MARRNRWGGRGGRGGYDDGYSPWPEYVPVAERKRRAEEQARALAKKGRVVRPVKIEGRTIAHTVWGKAWCDNLESYADLANRLERGRSYVRNGSVVDLGIAKGQVDALVQGNELYTVKVTVKPVPGERWRAIVKSCAGQIGSLVELLRGKVSAGVMQVVSRHDTGLFPTPKELSFTCSCPDYAGLCKHIGAALYGVGARFDSQPELLFELRGVDPSELVAAAATGGAIGSAAGKGGKGAEPALAGADLGALFGIELEGDEHGTAVAAASAKMGGAKKAAAAGAARKGGAAAASAATGAAKRVAVKKGVTRESAASAASAKKGALGAVGAEGAAKTAKTRQPKTR